LHNRYDKIVSQFRFKVNGGGVVMFKTETHLHLSEVSVCSMLSAEETVLRYHKEGYKTLFITDHFQKSYFDRLGDISWEDKIESFLTGYALAKKAGEKLGMNIILSAEIAFNGSCNHYLVYGIDEAFLKSRPDLLDMTIEDFYPYAKEQGVTVVQAHPFRDKVCTPTPEFVDALEVYNSNPRHENNTDIVTEIALNFGSPMTSGSDSHRIEDLALSGVITEKEIRTAADYVEQLMGGKLKMIKKDAEL